MKEISSYSTTVKVLALCKTGGMGPRLFDALFHRYGSLDNILAANIVSLLTLDGMTKPVADKIVRAAKALDETETYAAELNAREIRLVTRFDTDYPNLLFELNDPPALLYVRGTFPDPDKKTAALVGTSNPTAAGIEMTTRVAREFAAHDVQVISTFRGGIDIAAHLGARAAKGVSFAVIDSGFDRMIENELRSVALDISHTGGVISEYAPKQDRPVGALEETNRLLVGLSQAVVVTEFYHTSPQTLDLLSFCQMIGKLAFMLVDPDHGAFADEESLGKALEFGVIPLEGYDKVHDIIKSLV